MATFGYSTDETTLATGWADVKSGNRHALLEAGLISKLTIYIDNLQTGHAATHIRGLIYSDASIQPDALLATGDAIAVADNAALAWLDLTFAAPLSSGAADLWLAFHADAAGNGLGIHRALTGGTSAYNADTYSDGPENPFGAHTDGTRNYCLYATYTAAGGIGKLAWWLSAAKWNSPWEPRPSGLLLPKRALATI